MQTLVNTTEDDLLVNGDH